MITILKKLIKLVNFFGFLFYYEQIPRSLKKALGIWGLLLVNYLYTLDLVFDLVYS